jgi:hypothetical protein
LTIQCYDDYDQPVPKWPADPTINPEFKAAPSSQPTIIYNPTKIGPLVVVGDNVQKTNHGVSLLSWSGTLLASGALMIVGALNVFI